MAQMLSTIDQAVSDAAAALLRAEQDCAAVQTALDAAAADVADARQVLERLRRLRDDIAGDTPA